MFMKLLKKFYKILKKYGKSFITLYVRKFEKKFMEFQKIF